MWEADTLKGKFGNHQTEFQERTLIALPGVGNEVIPFDLYRLYRHPVPELTATGIEPLLRVILDQPKYVKPPMGNRPALPPVPNSLTRSADTLPPPRPLAPSKQCPGPNIWHVPPACPRRGPPLAAAAPLLNRDHEQLGAGHRCEIESKAREH